MRRGPLLLASLLGLPGCASLKVDVDVVDPAFAQSAATEAGLRLDLAAVLQSPHAQADAAADRIYRPYADFQHACLEERIGVLKKAAEATPPDPLAAVNIANLRVSQGSEGQADIARARAASVDAMEKADDAVTAAARITDPPSAAGGDIGRPLSDAVRAALLRRRDVYADEAAKVKGYIGAQTRRCSEELRKYTTSGAAKPAPVVDAAAEAAEAIAKQGNSSVERVQTASEQSVVGGGLLLNQMVEAYFITSADESHWAPRYNRAFGRGFGGSTSIALKMNDTADFSVKGFVFDGRSTAELVKKVGTSALTIIASASGAPPGLLKAPAPAGGETAAPAATPDDPLVSDSETQIAAAQARQLAYDATLFRLADSIMTSWDTLTQGGPGAKDAVQAGFDAYKDTWKPKAK